MAALKKGILVLVFASSLVFGAGAAVILIPDGDPNGVSDTVTLSSPYNHILSLQVTLDISGDVGGGFNGDLYATLTCGAGYAVLLNRVGRRTGNLFGYSDDGFDHVTFDDAAANGDAHVYRLTLNGNETTPLSGPLTGTWQPDGRAVDPDVVLGTDVRTALLGSFVGLDPNGDWTLFLADLSPGGASRLESWSLDIGGEVIGVPEPSLLSVGIVACAVAGAVLRRRVRRGSAVQAGGGAQEEERI